MTNGFGSRIAYRWDGMPFSQLPPILRPDLGRARPSRNTAIEFHLQLYSYFVPSPDGSMRDAALVPGKSGLILYPLTIAVDAAPNNGLSVNVSYDTPCATLSPAGAAAGPESSTGTIEVSGSCSWIAATGTPWITITAGANGTGPGAVSYSIEQNTTPASRTGFIFVARQQFTVSQAGQLLPQDNHFLHFARSITQLGANRDKRACVVRPAGQPRIDHPVYLHNLRKDSDTCGRWNMLDHGESRRGQQLCGRP